MRQVVLNQGESADMAKQKEACLPLQGNFELNDKPSLCSIIVLVLVPKASPWLYVSASAGTNSGIAESQAYLECMTFSPKLERITVLPVLPCWCVRSGSRFT